MLVHSTLWHCQRTVDSLHHTSLLTLPRKSKHPTSTRKDPSMNSNTHINPITNHPISSTSKRPAPKNNTAQNERYLHANAIPQKSCYVNPPKVLPSCYYIFNHQCEKSKKNNTAHFERYLHAMSTPLLPLLAPLSLAPPQTGARGPAAREAL